MNACEEYEKIGDIDILDYVKATEPIQVLIPELEFDDAIDDYYEISEESTENIQQNLSYFDAEAESRKHFISLKKKYGVSAYKDNSPISRLHRILLQLEDDELIPTIHVEWLKKKI